MTAATSRVLFVAAHPDDADFLAGGTIAKLVKDGREVAYVVATNGNKGSADPNADLAHLVSLCEAEQRQAASILGDVPVAVEFELRVAVAPWEA